MVRVWLIGGTQESAALAAALEGAAYPYTVTVTTPGAIALYPQGKWGRVWVGRLTPKTMDEFIRTQTIAAVVDASHPFAEEITRGAIAAASRWHLPYLRLKRPHQLESGAIYLDSFETLLAGNYLRGQRVLLVVGMKVLPSFAPWQEKATLFARILPTQQALSAAIAAGFAPERLLALRPPVSFALEKALCQQWQISLLVAKASGSAGGEDVKAAVARELGIGAIFIARPPENSPHSTQDLSQVLAFCDYHLPKDDSGGMNRGRSDYSTD